MKRDTALMWVGAIVSTAMGYVLSEWSTLVTWFSLRLPYKWLLMLSLSLLFALAFCIYRISREKRSAPDVRNISTENSDTFHNILALIAKYQSQEVPATPKCIATDLGLDPEVTLAQMWKYHNEQFITFRNDGKKPELDTAFFLNPKAWNHISIAEA